MMVRPFLFDGLELKELGSQIIVRSKDLELEPPSTKKFLRLLSVCRDPRGLI